ncbi:hypothetical protein AB0N17_07260 [Streptomyces sp. NPDC051133]|uniref:hypothetical protein n=1 Tax=Streptomyces sp. NPDC051133 TaxID=3155521 RepID=UPI00342D53B7
MFMSLCRPARRPAVLLLAALLPVAGCAFMDDTAKVSMGQVVGTWKAADGEELSFAADRTFISTGLDSKKLAEEYVLCPGERATGTWSFVAADGSASTADKVPSGSQLALYFDEEPKNCVFELLAIDGGKTLCVTVDLDDPCTPDVRFTRRK